MSRLELRMCSTRPLWIVGAKPSLRISRWIVFVEEVGADYQSMLTETLTETQNDNLQQIQSYFDTSTTWCIDDKGAYSVCPEESQQVERAGSFLLPLWAIITLAATSVILCCCLSWCIISYINQRDAANDRRNVETFIQSGKTMNDTKPRKRRQLSKARRTASRPTPHMNRIRSPRRSPQRSPRRNYETGSIGRIENRDPDIKYLEAMPSSELSEGKKTQHKYANDTLHLENMPSFIFDDGDAQPPQEQLLLGDKYDDEESYHFDDNRPKQPPPPTAQWKLMLEP